jgi:phospholipase/carboxylesterase
MIMTKALDGPRLGPAAGGAPDSLVVLLHGYGASGDDLIALGRHWQPLLPRTAFVAPNAPERLPQATLAGYQWFHLTLQDPGEYWRGVQKAAPALQAFIDAELFRQDLLPARLVLVGFSQGTMMALHLGLRQGVPPAAVVGFSGLLAMPAGSKPHDVTSRPPTMLIHGEADDVIPVEALLMSACGLAAQGVPVEWHVRPALGHGIDETGLALAGGFLKHALG